MSSQASVTMRLNKIVIHNKNKKIRLTKKKGRRGQNKIPEKRAQYQDRQCWRVGKDPCRTGSWPGSKFSLKRKPRQKAAAMKWSSGEDETHQERKGHEEVSLAEDSPELEDSQRSSHEDGPGKHHLQYHRIWGWRIELWREWDQYTWVGD